MARWRHRPDHVSEARPLSHADQTLRGLRYIGSARILTQVVTWGLTAITVRLLDPRDYGLVATAGIVTTFAGMLIDGGLNEVLISQRDLSDQIQGAATTASLLIAAVLGGIIYAIAAPCAEFFRSPPLRAIIEVSAFYLPLAALLLAPSAYLYKHMRYGRVAIIQAVSNIAQGLCTLGFAYLGVGYWALIIGVFVGTGIRVAMLWLSLERKPWPNLSLGALEPLVRSSSHILGQRFTYFAIDNFDLFLLSRFGGPAVLGPYSVARNLSHTALNQISGIVKQVTVPAFAARVDTGEQLRGLVFVATIASTLLYPLFWIIGVASQVALPLIFGPKWMRLVVPFLAFSAVLPLRGMFSLLNSSVIGTGKTGTSFVNTLAWAVILLPLMALGTPYGADGVALSWTVGFPFVFYIGMRRIAAAYSAPASTLLKPQLIPMICAGASALAAEAVYWVPAHFLPKIALVACQCGVGTVCYGLLLRAFGRTHYSQSLLTVRRLIRS